VRSSDVFVGVTIPNSVAEVTKHENLA